MMEYVEPFRLEPCEYEGRAEPRESKLPAKPAPHGVAHGAACIEQRSRPLSEHAKRSLPFGRDPACVEVGLPGAGPIPILARHVQTPPAPVDGEILPEVRQLKGGAHGVRLGIEGRIFVPGDPQDEPSDGIGGSAAVVEQVGPGFITRGRHILTERVEEIGEKKTGEPAALDGIGKSLKNEVRSQLFRDGDAEVAAQASFPCVQQAEAFGVCDAWFVREVVGPTRERIDRRDVWPHRGRQQSRGDRKVFIVLPRKPFAVGIRSGAIGSRKFHLAVQY